MNTFLPGDCDEPWEYELVDFYFTMSKITAAKFEHNIRSSKKMLFVTRKVIGASKFVQWRFLSQPWLLDKMVDWFDTRNSDDFQTFNNFIRQTLEKFEKPSFKTETEFSFQSTICHPESVTSHTLRKKIEVAAIISRKQPVYTKNWEGRR